MLGFWDYTVILTYISFASSVAGIFCTMRMHLNWAVFCLAFSGLCDMFDGKVARSKKDRTQDEKNFGIQIDSLCDMVCFGVLPIVICYQIGMGHIYSMAILVLYGLAGVVRLGYFNVVEAKRQMETDADKTYYQGLPITSMAIALPILFALSPLFPSHRVFLAVLHVLVAGVGILFITDFKLRKPSARVLFALVAVVAVAVMAFLCFGKDRNRHLKPYIFDLHSCRLELEKLELEKLESEKLGSEIKGEKSDASDSRQAGEDHKGKFYTGPFFEHAVPAYAHTYASAADGLSMVFEAWRADPGVESLQDRDPAVYLPAFHRYVRV